MKPELRGEQGWKTPGGAVSCCSDQPVMSCWTGLWQWERQQRFITEFILCGGPDLPPSDQLIAGQDAQGSFNLNLTSR